MNLSNPVARIVCGLCLGVAVTACDSAPPPAPDAEQAPPKVAATSTPPAPVKPANRPPEIRSVQIEPESPVAGQKLRAVVDASDPDGDGLWFHYQWKVDGEPAGDGDEDLPPDGLKKGQSVEVSVVANDGTQASAPGWAQVDLLNSPPEILELGIEPSMDVVSGTPIVVHPKGSDVDGDDIDYHFAWTVNGRDRRIDRPLLDTRKLVRGDVVHVRVVASDGRDDGREVESPAIVITNSPPHIVSRPPTTLANGVFRYRVVAEDPDGDSLFEFQLEQAPEGMRIEPQTGEITWTPGPDQAGVHPVTVLCEDGQAGVGRHEFEVRVSAPAGAPETPAAPAAPTP